MNTKLREAIETIKAGDKENGRRLLAQILKVDPNNERAWLWLASVVDDPQKRKQCLRQVLKLNPENRAAKKQAAHLEGQELKDGSTDLSLPESRPPAQAPSTRKTTSTIFTLLGAIFVACLMLAVFIMVIGVAFPGPAITPTPTPVRGPYADIEALVREIGGERVKTFYFDSDSPGGYFVTIDVDAPGSQSRAEMLRMAYDLMHHFHYNYTGPNSSHLSLQLRGDEVDFGCVFGLGIGHLAVPQYLPETTPSNLESWFRALVTAGYYGDLPGETNDLQAYGGDPNDSPVCDINRWKR